VVPVELVPFVVVAFVVVPLLVDVDTTPVVDAVFPVFVVPALVVAMIPVLVVPVLPVVPVPVLVLPVVPVLVDPVVPVVPRVKMRCLPPPVCQYRCFKRSNGHGRVPSARRSPTDQITQFSPVALMEKGHIRSCI